MVITAEHMIFINDNDVGDDDEIPEFEEKNKSYYSLLLLLTINH